LWFYPYFKSFFMILPLNQISTNVADFIWNFESCFKNYSIFIKFQQHFTALFHNTREEYIISQLHSRELRMPCPGFLARTIAWLVCSNDKETQNWSVSKWYKFLIALVALPIGSSLSTGITSLFLNGGCLFLPSTTQYHQKKSGYCILFQVPNRSSEDITGSLMTNKMRVGDQLQAYKLSTRETNNSRGFNGWVTTRKKFRF
jgi:hypothetical protein